ncbi:DNA topoisomerase VI subunit A [Encephalitozoon hellem ATCC 50504]|uniref:DNA topoisomerase (ATP-hydrolyzing) n=1 Tax=Encephalitozoon hellem TaxID=27973 RepID=A0A9Q9FBA9_ENCHE|nr:DNA topoisomerase VI subunit A [Encephalitozoon hellem ATCC 50504]AFM98154.1 DNA topoisomerase VI subunit A [Encephalitozoon hellem ATCC 50504]UTX43000.1 DNA topoisomerase VI subunit A [Encephalitozoon hellem]|eukprot:XP_003887135.1 DNA topoisomerase VI subunit A [Encephalitozoon hellem ATCC 50504]
MTAASNTICRSLRSSTLRLLIELKSRTLAMRIRLHEIIIEMQESGIDRNEREIFYMDVGVFKTQSAVKRMISSIVLELEVSRHELRVKNTLKGTFIGNLTFIKCGSFSTIEISSGDSIPQLIPDMTGVKEVLCNYKRVLVVEKDTILQRIASEIRREKRLEGMLLVCGRGYPCRNTMLLLKMLEHRTAISGLFDFDPFGIHIFCVYKYGSKASPDIKVSTIERIGVCMEDVLRRNCHEGGFSELNVYDLKMIDRLAKFKDLTDDLLFLKKSNKKVEMEAFFSKTSKELRHFLCKVLRRT